MANQDTHEDEAIRTLDSSDRVGNAGEILGALAGVAGGTAAASALASAVGVTTIPVLTSAASMFGITVLTATPIGWIAGAGFAGGLVVFGIGKLIRSGGKQDQIRQDLIQRLKKKLHNRPVDRASVMDSARLQSALQGTLERGLIEQAQAERLVCLVAEGDLDVEIALARLRDIKEA